MTVNPVFILFASFIVMCLLRTPIAFSLMLSATLTVVVSGISPIVIVQNMYAGIDSYTLLAVPLFLLAGAVMERGSVTERLVGFSRAMVGHIPGSLGHVTILSNMLMAGISGSAVADSAAIGGIMIPSMKKEGYPREMAVAVTAASATIGPIIPPSLIMVIYGAYGGVSIGGLFLGGAVPGMIFGLSLMGVVYFWARRHAAHRAPKSTWRDKKVAFRRSFLALLAPIIIVGGIVGGIFTATESAMVAVIYTFIVSSAVYRKLSWRATLGVFREAFMSLANPLFCVAAAGAFGYVMAYLRVPDMIMDMVPGILGMPRITLLFIVALYLLLGTFMDAIPAIIIFLPIVQKLVNAAGLDPVHVGVVITTVLCFGFLTPPYGLTLLLCSGIGGAEVPRVVRALLPMYAVMLAVILILVFFPSVVMFLPRLFF